MKTMPAQTAIGFANKRCQWRAYDGTVDIQSHAQPHLAIGPHGELAVADFFRMQVFASDGALRWSSWGIWGGGSVPSHVVPGRVYDDFGFTYLLDGEKGTWQPESYHRGVGNVLSDCRIGGQTFIMTWGPGWKETWLRFTPEKITPVESLEELPKWQYQWRRDTNGDGLINEKDTPTLVCDAQGKPIEKGYLFHHMYNALLPDGSIISAQRPDSKTCWLSRWPSAGLDAQRVPIYRWEDRTWLTGADKVISPYTWKPDTQGIGQFEPRSGGGWFFCTNLTSSPSTGHSPFNNGGSDVVGVGKDGSTQWVRTFGNFLHIGGFCAGNGLCIAGMATTCDFHVMDADGLGLPGFSSTSAWLDHVQATVSFVDQAGKLNVLVTDCTKSCNDWFRLDTCDLRRTVTPVTVSPDTAALLAGLLASPADVKAGKPPTMVVHVPHLKAPMKIDGDPQKWRDAGIAPQVIITPEAGAVRINGPRDCSVLIRYAWEGQNLYIQALKFDKVICMPRNATAYPNMHDTVEMAINSYLYGMKFNFTITQEQGPVIYCDGGWKYHVHLLDPDHAPRVFKVLNSTDLPPELKLMEGIAGVDMSDLKIELFEAKLPIDAITYTTDFKDALWEVKAGQQFWLNYLIDDNDEPGSEQMRFISWPPGSGTFMPKENGMLAILDE